MSIEVVPLSPVLGAEVRGLDLSRPLDPDTVAEIRAAWVSHRVLVFRGQTLTEKDQARFAGYFGALQQNKSGLKPDLVENPEFVLPVSNIKDKDGTYLGTLPDGDLVLHADSIWTDKPPIATTLFSVEIPSKGGETFFADMYRAYDTLPDDLKSLLDSRQAVFSYSVGARYAGDALGRGMHGARHPATVTHPESGKRVVFVNRLMTTEIEGLAPEQSQAVLERVFAHIDNKEFRYEHKWRLGDLVMWDNRCTQHGRNDFDPAERRLMKRVVVKGDWIPVR